VGQGGGEFEVFYEKSARQAIREREKNGRGGTVVAESGEGKQNWRGVNHDGESEDSWGRGTR